MARRSRWAFQWSYTYSDCWAFSILPYVDVVRPDEPEQWCVTFGWLFFHGRWDSHA